jgi:PAS domain S-box-containing protein
MRSVEPDAVCMVVTDLTERKKTDELKRMQQVLRASEARFRSVLDNSRDVIYRLNLQTGRYDYISPSAEVVLGFPVAKFMEMDSKTSLAMIHPDDLPAMRTWVSSLEEAGEAELEYRQRTKNGDYRWISNRASLVKDNSGRPLYRNGNIRDITESKQAADELREREAQLATLTNFVPQFVWMCTPDGSNIYFNQRWVDYTGMTLEESYGKGWNTPFHPDDKQAALSAWDRAVETGEQYRVESRLRAADGTYRRFLVRAEPMRDTAKATERWFGTCTDIEDIKRAEEALLRSEKLASVGRMAATIAHEINNPLETIGHGVYLALSNRGTPPEVKSYLELATKELEQVRQITKRTLSLSRERNERKLVDLRESVESTLRLFDTKLQARRITVEKRYSDVGRISALSGEIQQVISNLLSNSMDATPNHGKVQFRLSRTITRRGLRAVRFTVADTGCGIPKERLKKIFEPFFTTKEVVGNGLGLWVTKQIVEKLGAEIRVRSKIGKGTAFSIVFLIDQETQKLMVMKVNATGVAF